MNNEEKSKVAIINYGMGNLFSIKNACANVGLNAIITSSEDDILYSDAVILPGVGAFGRAMDNLKNLGLIDILKEIINKGKPFLGICLGMQLLMSKSYEFGEHQGFNILKGEVINFNDNLDHATKRCKVPHVGWNEIYPVDSGLCWENSLLNGLNPGDFFYFVHSYYVKPEDQGIVLTTTTYGDFEFCSSIQYKNICACQFHPERSGKKGMVIYKNLFNLIKRAEEGKFSVQAA